MMPRTRYAAFAVCVIFTSFLAVGTSPAFAGWFSSSPLNASTVSDQAMAQIQTALDDQRYLDAGKLLDQALVGHGDDPRLLLLGGQINLARGRYENALANFKSIDSVPAMRPRAMEGEGVALSLLGRSEDAVTALQVAVTQDPKSWHAWNALGTEFDRRHDWQMAEDAYGHAISSSAGSELVLNNRGFSRLSQKRVDEAIPDFVAALNKKPDFTAARNNLRLAMAMKGDYERAVAGANATDRAAILNNVGFAAMLRGDYNEAKDLFARAMKARGDYYAMAAANLEMTRDLADHGDSANGRPPVAH
jgi:Flp pilus assembly protein TadD